MKNHLPGKSIFAGQHIQHHKGPSHFFRPWSWGKSAYRPGGYGAYPGRNKNLIELIPQRPVKAARLRIKKPGGFKLPTLSLPKLPPLAFFKAKPGRAPEAAPRPAAAAASPGSPPKQPLPRRLPLAPAAGLGGIIFFSILCLNWQGIPGAPRGPGSLPEPGADGHLQRPLAAYAGIHTPAPVEDNLIPLALTEIFAWEPYTVQKGDSVSKIAQDHALSMDAVIASNGIANARRLREGDLLRLPNMNGIPYTVKKGDTLSRISSVMGVPLEVILDANDLQNDTLTPGMALFLPGAKMRTEDLKLALGELFIYPIRGRLTSPFGWRNDPISGERRYHAALDLAASLGTPVKAAMDGKVSFVGVNSVFGKYIILSHTGGYQTLYAHLNQTAVAQGTAVLQGTRIGEVGSTGYSTGPHLHFAVFKNGREVNPLDYLSP